MGILNLPIFEMLSERMAWLGTRQKVLAENIANADTPGYTPVDLSEEGFRNQVLRRLGLTAIVEDRSPAPARPGTVSLTATHRDHLTSSRARDRALSAEEGGGAYDATPSGNAVVLEEQMTKIAGTRMDFQLAANLYERHLNLLRAAISRR